MQTNIIIKEFFEIFKEKSQFMIKILISKILNKPISEIHVSKTYCNFILTDEENEILMKYFTELKTGKPISKVINEANFYGYNFFVNEHVLDPRCDTECLIDAVKDQFPNFKQEYGILDLCTGSGIILITLLREHENSYGIGVDVSNEAICVAKKNVILNFVENRAKIVEADLRDELFIRKIELENFRDAKFDIIVSNPPYIKSDDIKNLPDEVKRHDPLIALDGGKDGLFFYRKILENIKKLISENSTLFFEIGYDIYHDVQKISENAGFYEVKSYKDLNQIVRVIALKLR